MFNNITLEDRNVVANYIKKNNVFTSNIDIKKILCFEPDKNTFECLEKNLSNNKIVTNYNFGLGLKTMSLKLYKNKMNSGDSSFVKKTKIYEICKIKKNKLFFKKKLQYYS